jgi:hypothetical protein
MEAGVGVIKALLRVYSYIFGALLALFSIAVSGLALAHHTALNLGFLPWTGTELLHWLLFSSLFGFFSLLLAITGRLRVLFFLWTVAVCVMLFRGFFLSKYSFTGPVPFKLAVYLTAGSFLAMIGAWPWTRTRQPMRRPMKY